RTSPRARSTYTWPGCGGSWKTIRATRSSSRPSTAWGTAWKARRSLLPRLLDHALHGHAARLRALRLPGLQVVAIAGGEQVELSAGIDPSRAVVDRDVPRPHHLEAVAAHHDRGVLVEADPEELGMARDHGDEVELAVAPQQVLVDGHVLQEAEPLDVVADHDRVALRVAAHHERAQDGRAGGSTADHAAAGQHVAEGGL